MVEIAEPASAATRQRDREIAGPGGLDRDTEKGIAMADTDPAALEREIERTRVELARTVDAIADRVSPKRVAGRGVAKVKSNAEHFVATVGDLVTGNSHRPARHAANEAEAWQDDHPPRNLAPILIGVGAVLAVGATIALLRRRRRRR
jgi:hypothetical protein